MGKGLAALHQPVQPLRRAAAGLGHVDMRIGAEGDQQVGRIDHELRRVAVQIEADGDGNVRADDLAHPGDQLALAVVEMFGDHRAVQVEADAVERAGRGDAGDDLAGDALVGLAGDMGGGNRAGPQHRDHVPARSAAMIDAAGNAEIDADGALQDLRAARQRQVAAALLELGHGGERGGEGVGFVQEARKGDATAHRTAPQKARLEDVAAGATGTRCRGAARRSFRPRTSLRTIGTPVRIEI